MNRIDICVMNKIHITFQVPKVPNYLIREAFLGEKFLPYSARSNSWVTLRWLDLDGPDIHWSLQCTWLLENLLISEPSKGIMENFQCSSALPNIKYNCVVLFLSQLYILFIYASKYFLIDHHYKRYVRTYDLLAKGKIYWCSRSVQM